MIDKSSSKPLYVQLQMMLEQKILSGELKSGDRILSENEMAARYKVSRVTARQAIEQLVAKNILYRSPGKGTFVSEHGTPYGFSTMMSFSKSLASRGFSVTSLILDQSIIPASEEVAENLRLSPGVDVVIVRRLRIVDGVPAAIHTSYFSARAYSRILERELSSGSLLEIAEEVSGTKMEYSQDSLRAVPLSVTDADLLHMPPGSPMMELEGVVYDDNNVPCRYTKGVYRGDLFRLDVRNSRTNATLLTMPPLTSETPVEKTQQRQPRQRARGKEVAAAGSTRKDNP